jgi:hypothetical protein
MTADTLNAVAQAVGRAVIDRLFDRCTENPATPLIAGHHCLEWTGSTSDGYGLLRVGRRKVLVHRLLFELANHQRIPPGVLVMHECDNRRCCEPTHLRLGTPADNTADMVEKGRSVLCGRPGERNTNAKLSTRQVREIRQRYETGETQTALAREFGVHPSNVSLIVRGASWSVD